MNVLGIGCRRDTSFYDIKMAVETVLNKNKLSYESFLCIASIDLKKDELGLLEFAEFANLKIKFFSSEELNSVDIINPSNFVNKITGTYSVSEAAAILASKGTLILEKQKFKRVTVAVATIKK